MRECAGAVAGMKAAGLWTDALDTLIDQHLTAEMAEAGIADDEVARLRAYLLGGATPRANVETAIATHWSAPRLAHPGGNGVTTAPSPGDACRYWWTMMWIAAFFCIMLLGCFLVVFIAGVIVTLACAGR